MDTPSLGAASPSPPRGPEEGGVDGAPRLAPLPRPRQNSDRGLRSYFLRQASEHERVSLSFSPTVSHNRPVPTEEEALSPLEIRRAGGKARDAGNSNSDNSNIRSRRRRCSSSSSSSSISNSNAVNGDDGGGDADQAADSECCMAMRFLCAMRMRDDHKPHWFYLGRTRNDYRIAKLRLHRILDEPGSSAAAFWYNWFITLIVFIGYGISVLEITRDANLESAPYNGYFYPRTYQVALYPVLGLSAVDIVLRLLCSDKWFVPCECRAEHHHGEGCLSERPFFIQVYTWLDILALLGGFLGLGCFASALRFIRLAKHNRSFQIVVQVLSDSWADTSSRCFFCSSCLGFSRVSCSRLSRPTTRTPSSSICTRRYIIASSPFRVWGSEIWFPIARSAGQWPDCSWSAARFSSPCH